MTSILREYVKDLLVILKDAGIKDTLLYIYIYEVFASESLENLERVFLDTTYLQ